MRLKLKPGLFAVLKGKEDNRLPEDMNQNEISLYFLHTEYSVTVVFCYFMRHPSVSPDPFFRDNNSFLSLSWRLQVYSRKLKSLAPSFNNSSWIPGDLKRLWSLNYSLGFRPVNEEWAPFRLLIQHVGCRLISKHSVFRDLFLKTHVRSVDELFFKLISKSECYCITPLCPFFLSLHICSFLISHKVQNVPKPYLQLNLFTLHISKALVMSHCGSDSKKNPGCSFKLSKIIPD